MGGVVGICTTDSYNVQCIKSSSSRTMRLYQQSQEDKQERDLQRSLKIYTVQEVSGQRTCQLHMMVRSLIESQKMLMNR